MVGYSDANFTTDDIIPIGYWNYTLVNDNNEEVGPWIFFVILGGAIFGVFAAVGLCVVSHVGYMKFIKKP